MKLTVIFSVSSLALALVSCDFNQPLPGGDVYNPLNTAGASGQLDIVDTSGPSISPGGYMQTTSSMTALFSRFPGPNDQPSKTLSNYTDVKVISIKGSYVKVEVVNTGDVGYVPAVMLGEKRSRNEVQVTSGLGGVPVTPGMAPQPEILDVAPPELGDASRPSE